MNEQAKIAEQAPQNLDFSPVSPSSPITDYLQRVCSLLAPMSDGQVADYIPELSKANPDWLGICVATVDGRIYTAGDTDVPFTIQSVSKPFLYGYALREYGRDYVLSHVGVEPTGEAFNAIVLDEINNRPFNPMVNAGAMAVAELMKGATPAEREDHLLELFGQFAGRTLRVNDAVFLSEKETGHRNRAIAHMMLNTKMIGSEPEALLDVYFKQCSIDVTCQDLAVMAATLANDGVNPKTGSRVLGPDHVRDVLTVMHSCGMYNYAGQWAFEVGVPAKSGVSGGVIAVIPGQIGIGVFSPRLDPHGNSVRGVQACKELSKEFGLHVFGNSTSVHSALRREYRGDQVGSNRLRTQREQDVLAEHAHTISVIEVQGPLYFGTVEQVVNRVQALAEECDFVIIDFKRVHSADAAASKLFQHLMKTLSLMPCQVLVSHFLPDQFSPELCQSLSDTALTSDTFQLCPDTDAALEWCEDTILKKHPDLSDRTKFGLGKLELFRGLSPDELRQVEDLVRPFNFEKGDVILREGDQARLLFVVARGSVSVLLKTSGGKKRIACMGPGLSFGEMALLDGGKRSAEIVADDRVICYGLSVEGIHSLSAQYPNILITMLTNMARDFSERLRRGNDEIRALD